MARKERDGVEAQSRWRWLRHSVRVLAGGCAIAGGLYAFQRVERFLFRDQRFTVTVPDYGLESPSLSIDGVRYASRTQVLKAFAPDFGRSIYQVPLSERRAALTRVDWVREAAVARVWPNRLIIHVQERDPVAFLQIPDSNGLARFALIDGDGVILQPPKNGGFKLPVALGIQPEQTIPQRRERVHHLVRLIHELGPLSEKVSEVDVSDPDNLKVMSRANNRAVVLMLGDHNFAQRMQTYLNHFPQIQQRLPNAATLDLRLEDRITVVEGKTE